MAAGDPGSPARYYSSTAVETSLQSSIAAQSQGASNTSFIVASISGFPTSYPYTLIVDPDTSKEEVLTVYAGSGTTLSVYRGADNTQAVAHSAGAVVRHGVSAREFRESENHIAARGYDLDQAILNAANQTHVHGIAAGDGEIVGTTKAQTITNKVYSSGTVTGAFTATSATFNGGTFASPTINTPTVAGATISGTFTSTATVSGGTYSNATLGSALNAGGYKITNLATPTDASDAVRKDFADAQVAAAATSAASAATSASSAAASAATAAASVAAIAGYATSAANSASAAATSATSAAASATAAATSAASAATSATSSATSANASASSATAAATSATSAANSATAAATSASSAAASASAAATSATSAAASATTAAASVAAIAGYAAAAATSEANALTSANSAATSAASAAASVTAAATSAASAATSATSAANSATAAATSASSASVSAIDANTSAISASASATLANDWATLMTGPVAGGEFSAKYNADLAATSATSAATSATSAANSATAAATSAASAATSASSAAASYDQFDDRYLGDKTADPTVDNDGNPLLTGALYFNTVVGAMKVYDGAAWDLVAPDTSNFIDKSILSAKGALLGASAASTPYAVTPAATNGYILSIDSATTSGLAWIAPNPGDITAVTAGDGLTGGGTSGDVTLAVSSDVLRTTGGQVISANTSANALEIRQIGTGNALLVEDDTNPDSTPTVITNAGSVGIGISSPASSLHVDGGVVTTARYNNTGALVIRRANGTQTSPTGVLSGEAPGGIYLRGFDGVSTYRDIAAISSFASENISTTAAGGTLQFFTTPIGSTALNERMRIDSAGNVNIGPATPEAGGTNTGGLSIAGQDVQLMIIMGAWV